VSAADDKRHSSNWEAKLITDLMRDYNRYARPTIDVFKPIDTTIAFYLTKILGLVGILKLGSYNVVSSSALTLLRFPFSCQL